MTMGDRTIKRSVLLGIVFSIFIVALLIGYMVGSNTTWNSDPNSPSKESILAPVWEKGIYWVYSFNSPDSGLLTSRLGVAGEEGENYNVGVDKKIDAQRHAVLNFDPLLGRIGKSGLEIYEKDVAQPMFKFPLELSSNWTFLETVGCPPVIQPSLLKEL